MHLTSIERDEANMASQQNTLRILYMEDNIGHAKLLRRRLSRVGHQIDLAHDGSAGLEMAQQKSYDLIAVDYSMPEMNGLEVIAVMTEWENCPPIIMITGHGNERIAVEAMKRGASDYIVKDVAGNYYELLLSVTEKVIARRELELESQRLEKENKIAFAALQKHTEDLAKVNEITQQLTAILDFQEVLEQLLPVATKIVGAGGGSVWLWEDEQQKALFCPLAIPDESFASLKEWRVPFGKGLVGHVASVGQSTISNRAQSDNRLYREIDQESGYNTKSILAVPLRIRDRVIGVLELVNKKYGSFDEDDKALVETMGASAAIAIANARLIEQLRDQTVELQSRNEELDAFAHTVAHDLQHPLSVIGGYADLLLDQTSDWSNEDVTQFHRHIAGSAHKMSNIVGELLLLAKLRQRDVEHEPIDMNDVVTEALGRLTFMIEDSDAKISMPTLWPTVLGYGPWIEEVWVNYISNAIKYGGSPPVLKLGFDEQEDKTVSFWVEDNGKGIGSDEQDSLFVPFSQLDSRIRVDGHGLGLSIVRRIIEKLHGTVGVESAIDSGSRFTFSLPIAAPEAAS